MTAPMPSPTLAPTLASRTPAKTRVDAVYEAFKRRDGDTARKMGWDSREAQQTNFRVVLDELETRLKLPALSYHDVGCGYGDLIPVLQARGVDTTKRYLGTDFLPSTVEEARVLQPGHAFEVADAKWSPLPTADVTLCFGTLAFHKPRTIEAMLHRMWNASSQALGFISWWNLTPDYHYFDDAVLLRKCIRRFIRESRGHCVERIGDFCSPVEAMFVLYR